MSGSEDLPPVFERKAADLMVVFRVTVNDQDLVRPFVCLSTAMTRISWGHPGG